MEGDGRTRAPLQQKEKCAWSTAPLRESIYEVVRPTLGYRRFGGFESVDYLVGLARGDLLQMAAAPFVVGFVKFLLIVRAGALRIGREHVAGVSLEARQLGVAHLHDAVTQGREVKRLAGFGNAKLRAPGWSTLVVKMDLYEDWWLSDVVHGQTGFRGDGLILIFAMSANSRWVSHSW